MSPTAWVLLVAAVLLAALVGSFTCVVIDRMPYQLDEPDEYGDAWGTRTWREVVAGRSRCDTCGTEVRSTDNIPVLSYLLLRGRCRSCGTRIPAFHLLVELLVPLLFALAFWRYGWSWALLPVTVLIPPAVALAVIDLRTFIVPTRIIWPTFFVEVAVCAAAAGLLGRWDLLVGCAVGLAVFAGPLFAIWFIHPRGMGFGDVRLAVLVGWTTGFYADGSPLATGILVAIAVFVAAVLGIVIGIGALGARGRKAQVPFGPSIVLGGYTAIVLAAPILEAFGGTATT
ncbi:MAG: prepilin peptidase [Actinobacteria bacterium]|nr:prepilin peptidase [Actinomycetota bacterium]